VLVGVHHAANPKFSLRRNEEQLVACRAGPLDVLTPEQTALVVKDRLAGMNLLAATFSFNHRIDEPFELLALSAIHTKPP
jgi:hypothetical protein